MPYLSKKEIRRIQALPIEARLIYVFVLRARGQTATFASEDEMAEAVKQEIGDLLTQDGRPNHGAIRARIRTMLDAGLITRKDANALEKLLLDQH